MPKGLSKCLLKRSYRNAVNSTEPKEIHSFVIVNVYIDIFFNNSRKKTFADAYEITKLFHESMRLHNLRFLYKALVTLALEWRHCQHASPRTALQAHVVAQQAGLLATEYRTRSPYFVTAFPLRKISNLKNLHLTTKLLKVRYLHHLESRR